MKNVIKKNIELFKELIRREVGKKPTESESRTYECAINRITGELSFAETMKQPKKTETKEWKAIVIQVKPILEEGPFRVLESKGEKVELEPLAFRVMNETVDSLNQISQQAKEPEVEEILKIVSLSQPEFEMAHRDIVYEAWHRVDRVGAEKVLEGRPIGFYLFRKDDYCSILEQQLSAQYGYSVKCITLTFLGPDYKVSDFTLAKTHKGWVVYDDDPSLSGTVYPSVDAIIDSMQHLLKFPLLTEPHDLVHDAWYRVDRIEAEKLLKGQKEGTFLFRKDDYSDILEQQLKGQFPDIKCITLTYLGAAKKVSDLTLVKTEKGWLIYNDDPNLLEDVYSTIDDLIADKNEILKYPLLNQFRKAA